MINRSLKVIFLILITVILGEVGYYIYTFKTSIISTKPVDSQIETRDILSNIYPSVTTTSSSRPKEALVQQEVLDFIKSLQKSPNVKFHLKTETNGFIGGISEINDNKSYLLKIVDNQGKKVLNYVLAKEGVNNNHYYLVADDKKTTISFANLKVNDKILIVDEHEVRDNIIDMSFFIYR